MSLRSVEDWRKVVFRAPTKATVKLCCLYLADHMSADRKVSRPRRLIAEGLGVSERVVDRMVSDAHSAGLLTTVRRGQKGVTAVYQGLFPNAVSVNVSCALNRHDSRALNGSQRARIARTSSNGFGRGPDGRDVGNDEEAVR